MDERRWAKIAGVDAMKETQKTLLASKLALYGPLKVQSELEAEKWFPGKALIIRPGLIVGPGDESDRFTYWPVRLERGGEILAPGNGSDPVQLIDARDLAEWTIRDGENKARPASSMPWDRSLHIRPLTVFANPDNLFSKQNRTCRVWSSPTKTHHKCSQIGGSLPRSTPPYAHKRQGKHGPAKALFRRIGRLGPPAQVRSAHSLAVSEGGGR